MTLTSEPSTEQRRHPTRRGRWIDDWRPEDETFWEQSGRARWPAAT